MLYCVFCCGLLKLLLLL